MSRVIFWRSSLLPPSETFIRNQSDSLAPVSVQMLGAVRENSSLARAEDEVLFGDSIADRIRARAFFALGRSPRLRQTLEQYAPALVHAHFAPDAWLISRACRAVGVPLVVTLHGHDVTSWPRQDGRRGKAARRRLREVFRDADLIIAVSEFIRDQALSWGANADKVRVIYTGIPEHSRGDAMDHGDGVSFDVVFVGRLVGKKGVQDLLHAVAAVQARSSFMPRVGIIGDGPLLMDLRKLAAANGLSVEFLGIMNTDEVASTLKRSKILVNPSRWSPEGDAEGFGMVFLEAAAAGIPAISYKHGGVPEAIEDGVSGQLATEGDIAGLADRIEFLLANDAVRLEMGEAGRARFKEHFAMDDRIRDLIAAYDDVLRNLSN